MIKHRLHLHGKLREYGDVFDLCVNTPLEAIHLVAEQIEGLKDDIKKGYFRIIKGDIDTGMVYSNELSPEMRYSSLDMLLGSKAQNIHIVPVLQGSGGDNGVFGIIVGAVLMVAAVVAAPFTGGTSLAAGMSAFQFGFLGSTTFMLGAAMMLGGISAMLMPAQQMNFGGANSMEKADERPSYFLSAPINMMEQGGAVPVLFGEMFVGSVTLSASLEVYEI